LFQLGKSTVFGLDIGFGSVKVVQLKKSGKDISIVGFASEPIAEKSLQKTKILEKNKIQEALKKAVKSAKPHAITTKAVCAALPEHLVFTKVIELPKIKENALAKTIPYEAGEFMPISLEETYLDWQILGDNPDKSKIEVLVVAAPKTLVDDYIDLVKQADLQLFALETKPISAVRAIAKNEKEGLAILDIGAEASGIAIVDQGIIRLTGTVTVGANMVDKALQTNLNLKPEDASKIKYESGLSFKTETKTKEIIQQALAPITDELAHTIKYYQSRIKAEGKIAKIKLCGGGAAIQGIADYFSRQTGIHTEIGNPLVHLSKSSEKILSKTDALPYTTAIGLALRELG